MLEHVAANFGPWVDLIDNNLPKYVCTLSMTNSNKISGWLRKSNFNNDNDTNFHATRKLQYLDVMQNV